MAAYFLDSSAAVKRYVREIGTNWVISLFRPAQSNVFYVAQIISVEVVSALARRLRGNSLSGTQAAKAKARFQRNFQRRFFKVEVDALLVARATALADKYALRGYDAVQLAAALTTNDARIALGASGVIFVSADKTLNLAATAEGLAVENPQNYP